MKKEIKIIIEIFIGFLALLWLEKPLRELLITYSFEEINAKFLAGIFVRITLLILAIYLIKKLYLKQFTGLADLSAGKNIHATIIPLSIITMGIVSNWHTYQSAPFHTFTLFVIFVLSVGFLEEFIFRGTIFPLFIKLFKKQSKPLIKSAVFSSLLFGTIHFVNLFQQPDNLAGITSQVFFALSIGVFFCGLMVRTENILIPAIIHALINFGFGAGELKLNMEKTTGITPEGGINWNSVIPTMIFFTIILAGGLYMILKSDEKQVLDKCS